MAGCNPGVEHPYSSHVCGPNFVTMKLSGRDTYGVWKTQMLCLLESHDLLGFINGNPSTEGKWRRSDALVKVWILSSLSEKTLKHVLNLIPNTDFTSKDVWDKLQTIYGPPAPPPQDAAAEGRTRNEEMIEQETEAENKMRQDEEERKKKEKEKHAGALYEATLRQNSGLINRILSRLVITLRDKITINGNTALHVAVATSSNTEFLEKMFISATKDKKPLDMMNSEGSTVLHVAAIVGNTKAAKMLVKKDEDLLCDKDNEGKMLVEVNEDLLHDKDIELKRLVKINKDLLYKKDNEGQTPVARALSNMHTQTYLYLSDCYFHNPDIENGNVFDDIGDRELLANIISSKDYGAALSLVFDHANRFLSHIDSVLMAIAQNFPHKLNFWEKTVRRCMSVEFTFSGYHFATQFKFVEALKRKEASYVHAKKLLDFICLSLKHGIASKSIDHYYNNAILEATRQNAYKVVKIIVSQIPNAIWSTNDDGHNIIQYAVINRSEKVYNLLYHMSEHKNIYKTIKDPFGNNLLHLAARLAPTNKLNPISGAALQIQFELQWFKEVEGFVCALSTMQKNLFGETPQMVFTRQHKDLVIDGEKWMKETAQSYTITAALITTIVFAAAITVPGGNKQDNGMPVFTNKTAFTTFAISDAISLFTSATSLLMFLSILTARFSEQDFLLKLPTKLIIGLATLFISTTAMLVAFGATLFLVFGQNHPQILVLIIALTCLPIICFSTLQFSLIKDLMRSTYGGSIFGKKSDSLFY